MKERDFLDEEKTAGADGQESFHFITHLSPGCGIVRVGDKYTGGIEDGDIPAAGRNGLHSKSIWRGD